MTVYLEAYLAVVSTRVDVHEWLVQNEGLHRLVLPQSALKTVLSLGEDEPWSTVRQELLEVMESSVFGRRLCAFAAGEGIRAGVEHAIEEQEKLLLEEDVINAKPVRYRGATIQVPVRSLEEHCRLAMYAAVKGRAAESAAPTPRARTGGSIRCAEGEECEEHAEGTRGWGEQALRRDSAGAVIKHVFGIIPGQSTHRNVYRISVVHVPKASNYTSKVHISPIIRPFQGRIN
eukprot:6490979-Amphidinium_carterae.3